MRLNKEKVLILIRKKYGSVTAYARAHGCSKQRVYNVLNKEKILPYYPFVLKLTDRLKVNIKDITIGD